MCFINIASLHHATRPLVFYNPVLKSKYHSRYKEHCRKQSKEVTAKEGKKELSETLPRTKEQMMSKGSISDRQQKLAYANMCR